MFGPGTCRAILCYEDGFYDASVPESEKRRDEAASLVFTLFTHDAGADLSLVD